MRKNGVRFIYLLTVRANSVPVAPAVSNPSGTVGVAFGFALSAFGDADADPLTYTATGLPAGLWFDAGARVISGTPTMAGSTTVTYAASDGMGGSASTSFVIAIGTAPVPNQAPVVNLVPPSPAHHFYTTTQYVVPIDSFSLPADTFVDPDGNPLAYTRTGASWLNYEYNNGHQFSGVYPGPLSGYDYITLTAHDPSGATVSVTFSVYGEFYDPDPGTVPLSVPQPVSHLPASANAAAANNPGAAARAYRFDMGRAQGPGINGTGSGAITTAVLEPVAPQAGIAMTPALIPVQTTERWYTYDAENRLKVNNGKLVNGQIVVDAADRESYELLYDVGGRVVARYREFNQGSITVPFVYRTTYDLRGNKTLEFHGEAIGSAYPTGGVSKGFSYSANGTLVETRSYYAAGSGRDLGIDGEGMPRGTLDISGWLEGAQQMVVDGDGRTLSQISKERPSDNWWAGLDQYGGSPIDQQADLTVLADRSVVLYSRADGASGFDAAGRATTYRYRGADIGWATQTYTTSYEGWGSYLEKTVAGVSSNSSYKTTTNTLGYDPTGRLTSQREHTDYQTAIDDRMRYYAYNGEGRVQLRRAGTINASGTFVQAADPFGSLDNTLFVHAGGQQQAELKPGGEIRMWRGGTYNTAQLQSLGGSGNYAAGGGKVTVQAGETLSSLAQRIYGSPQRWYVLADANGLSNPDQALIEGTQLNAPKVNVSSNDANTFQPYDPGEAIGSTSPGLPYITPPPRQQCNALAMVLMIVVAVVVTYFTAGAATKAMLAAYGTTTAAAAGTALGVAAAVAGGFVGGVAGSVASQAVGSAMGVASFSWRSALVSGAATAATAGLAGAAQAGRLGAILAGTGKTATAARAVVAAMAGQVTSYGASRALGLEASFSWKSIAASAVGAALTANIGGVPLAEGGSSTGKFINDLGGGLLRGAITSTTRRVLGLGKQDWGQVAIDAFGNALGNAAVSGAQTLALRRQTSRMLEQMSPEQRLQLAQSLMLNFAPGDQRVGNELTRIMSDEELALSQADIDMLKAQGRDMTSAQQALDELRSRTYAGATDEDGLYNTPTAKPAVEPESGYEWAWGNNVGQWSQMPADGRITDLAAITAVPQYEWANQNYLSTLDMTQTWRMQGVQSSEAVLPKAWSHAIDLNQVQDWAGKVGDVSTYASHGLLFVAKYDAQQQLGRAWPLQQGRMKELAVSNKLDSAQQLFKNPNGQAATALAQSATKYGAALKGLGVVGWGATIVEEAAYLSSVQANHPDKIKHATGATLVNVAGGAGAIYLGAKGGALAGTFFAPFTFGASIPIGAVFGGVVGHYFYSERAKDQVREILTGIK